MKHRFNYKWTLKDAKFTKDKGKVFSCFACGGGSSMGYKLAGFDVIGCNEIDPKMMKAYKANHNPKFAFLEPIQTFKLRDDLPDELFNLDILDGSPPCSSFSMAGNREKDWGKEKKFREGQVEQILDDLFFDFIDLAKKLQPKVVVAENVAGLMMGEAKSYVRRIYKEFKESGYQLRIEPYLLNASDMGVPQKRRRVFFIALRNDIADKFMEQIDMFQTAPKLELNFNEPKIKFGEIRQNVENYKSLEPSIIKRWNARLKGDCDLSDPDSRLRPGKGSFFNYNLLYNDKVCNTITGGEKNILFDEPRYLCEKEVILVSSFPLDFDFDFLNINSKYLMGMSVPPIVMAQIASNIYEQWGEIFK